MVSQKNGYNVSIFSLPLRGIRCWWARSTSISRLISVFIDKFYALQNGPPNDSQQIFTWTTLRNSLIPSKAAVLSDAIANHPLSTLTDGHPTYGGQDLSGSETCSGTCQCSGKSEIWDAPNDMIGLTSTTAPLETPTLTCDSTTHSNSKTRDPAIYD